MCPEDMAAASGSQAATDSLSFWERVRVRVPYHFSDYLWFTYLKFVTFAPKRFNKYRKV